MAGTGRQGSGVRGQDKREKFFLSLIPVSRPLTPGARSLIPILLLLLLPFPAHALKVCKCGPARTADERRARAFAVFTGTVREIKRQFDPDRHKVTFVIHQSWKGVTNDTASVYTSGTDEYALIKEGITCGLGFEEGQSYLVYSYRDKNRHGPAHVSRCGGTKPLGAAADELQELGPPMLSFPASKAIPPKAIPPKERPPRMPPEREKEPDPSALPDGTKLPE